MSARIVIVGGGHNALVAATYLARGGLDVTVLERLDHVGGAAISARPWPGVDAELSRYSYLVSLMPTELIADLGLDLELRSRTTASYSPYDHGGLLVETVEDDTTRESFRTLTGDDAEFEAWQHFYREVSTMAQAVAPTLLEPLPHIGDIRDQVDMAIWTDLIDEPLGTAIGHRFTDDLVRGVVATDALIGTFASLGDRSLVHNRCFLYHLIGNTTGEWRVPVGGMGAVTSELERVARAAGVTFRNGAEVTSVLPCTDGVSVAGHQHGEPFDLEADWVLSNVAPYVLAGLLGEDLPQRPRGSQLKINLLVDRLPALKSGIDPAVAFAGTLHLDESYEQLESAHDEAAAGRIPTVIPGEIYCHTLTDPTILGAELAETGAHTLTYFGLQTPAELYAARPEAKDEALSRALAGLNAHLAEPIESVISHDASGNPCLEVKTPLDIDEALNMPGGHIFHGDLSWPWHEEGKVIRTPAEAWGVSTRHSRVLLAGSGAVRGGAVSGIAGHNAAHAVLDFYGQQTS